MIIPRHWDEARRSVHVGGRSVAVRRLGWSDDSTTAAARRATERLEEACAALLAGRKVEPWEQRVPYGGVDGLPIREEVLEEDGAGRFVVTRNSYGAHCFNARGLLMVEVGFEDDAGYFAALRSWYALPLFLWILVAWGAFELGYSRAIAAVSGFQIALVAIVVLELVAKGLRGRSGGQVGRADRRLGIFLATNADWRVRVYGTPRGRRIVALHRLFDPVRDQAEVEGFFSAVKAAPKYARMCRLRRCFRARLTAKPWRIGIHDHMPPRGGGWPVDPVRRRDREHWVADYEAKCVDFAACRLIEDRGAGRTDEAVARLVAEHDERARTTSGLPIA